jgi:hypothetical protein
MFQHVDRNDGIVAVLRAFGVAGAWIEAARRADAKVSARV